MPSNTVISDTKQQDQHHCQEEKEPARSWLVLRASSIAQKNSLVSDRHLNHNKRHLQMITHNEIIKSRRRTRQRRSKLSFVQLAQSSVTASIMRPASYLFYALLLASLSAGQLAMSSGGSPFDFAISQALGVETQAGISARSLPLQQHSFDPSSYKSVHEAIRGHPELREFAQLCEQDGVKEIVSMDKTPLTVFAPVDRSMSDLLAKAKLRSINLADLAKHHIAQGFVMPDENTKYPFQFSTYSLLSPLYLQQQPKGAVFVNNAKILATHLVQIDADNYQTLHIIDQPLEFAYLNRRAQLRAPPTSSGAQGSSGGQMMSSSRKTTVKRSAFNLDDLFGADQSPIYEFYERFGDVQANLAQVDLYHARVYRGTAASASNQLNAPQRIQFSKDQFNLELLAKVIRQHAELRGKLYNVNETNSLNTYFLPINTDELESLLEGGNSLLIKNALALEAHVIPDQVLFTRTMSLGLPHSTLFDRHSGTHQVSLSLAKTLPSPTEASGGDSEMLDRESDESRRYLSTPLLLQSKCSSLPHHSQHQQPWRSGLTSAEILVANIPLSNGVLHLIKKPMLITEQTSLLDYINDHDNQLSDVVNAAGSRSAPGSAVQSAALGHRPSEMSVGVNRFRELLARERQLLSALSMDPAMNKTIFAPSDEAFSKLRYDLRALVQSDDSLIPKHWDASYRRDLLERLVKRHVVLQQTLTSENILNLISQPEQQQQQIFSDNGKLLNFLAPSEGELLVESDSTQACLLHKDLIGNNGVLHIIDRVLGEEQETVYSLMKSIVIKYNHSLEENNLNQNELNSIIQANIRGQQQADLISSTQNSLETNELHNGAQMERRSPELQAISRSIGQYLDELAGSNRRQLQLLASSVNTSYQLARLVSLADGTEDWNQKFKIPERRFTYFVPSDLAWIKLQQSHPELYKPLMYFLESSNQQQQQQQQSATEEPDNGLFHDLTTAKTPVSVLRSSESSHRLRQILERHLVSNKKLDRNDLERLDSLQTLGATLRLIDGQSAHQLTALGSETSNSPPSSAFAALHSIVTGANGGQLHSAVNQQANQHGKFKSLKLGDSASANIVQANEASNGFVYIIDNVLLLPEDADHITQTSSTPAISSTMSSLLGGHNSAILDFINNLLSPSNAMNLSAQSMLALIGTLTLAIAVLLILTLALVIRRRRQNKLNRHQHLESGLTSSSSANSGSTSTTKSL